MQIEKTILNGVYIIKPEIKSDTRGYFTRIFCTKELHEKKIDFTIVQANQSLTKQKNTLRGLHFQTKPYEEKKIVQCLQGKIYDVVVNIQPQSEQYGNYIAIELSEENKNLLYIPEGFAHGFLTQTDNCIVQYLMNEYYHPESAKGVAWNDPFFNIHWPDENPKMSEKDQQWPFLNEANKKT